MVCGSGRGEFACLLSVVVPHPPSPAESVVVKHRNLRPQGAGNEVAVRPPSPRNAETLPGCRQSTKSPSDPPPRETSKRRPRHGPQGRRRAPAAVAFWRKGDSVADGRGLVAAEIAGRSNGSSHELNPSVPAS